MTMTISKRIVDEGAQLYYTPGWHLLIESHLQWLLSRADNRLLTVDNGEAYKYEGDLSGLLLQHGIPVQYHWIVMRMNGFTSYSQYRVDKTQLILPDEGVIQELRAAYQTTAKKIT